MNDIKYLLNNDLKRIDFCGNVEEIKEKYIVYRKRVKGIKAAVVTFCLILVVFLSADICADRLVVGYQSHVLSLFGLSSETEAEQYEGKVTEPTTFTNEKPTGKSALNEHQKSTNPTGRNGKSSLVVNPTEENRENTPIENNTNPTETQEEKTEKNTDVKDFLYSVTDKGIAIDKYAGSDNYVKIPNRIEGKNVVKISEGAFEGKTVVSKVTIPDTVTVIGANAFRSTYIREVNMSENIEIIDDAAFFECKNLQSINLYNVKEIGHSAFKNCKSIEKLTLPESLNKIGIQVFQGCSNLKELNFNCKDLTGDLLIFEHSYKTFYNCSSLKTVKFGNNVKVIPSGCFMGCTSIETIEIPSSMEDIHDCSFYGCSNLKKVSFENGVKYIRREAFYGCGKLSDVNLPGSLNTIGSKAFYNCTSLKEYRLLNNISYVDEDAIGYYSVKRKKEVIEKRMKDVVIYCYENSYANRFAIQNNYIVESLGEDIPQTAISLKSYIENIYVKESFYINPDVENPLGDTTYTSANPKVATVNNSGKVVGISKGKTEIVVSNNGVSKNLWYMLIIQALIKVL